MTSYLDRLNLRPFEKRLVVGVGAVLFLVLNAWFVVPHFSDLSQARDRRLEALKKLERWQAEIDQKAKYEVGINKFRQEGREVPAEEQQNQFARAIQDQQVRSGVGIQQFGRVTTQTNQFFLELTQPISVQSGEAQLVDFLYNLKFRQFAHSRPRSDLAPGRAAATTQRHCQTVASYQKNQSKMAAPAASPAPASKKSVTTTAKRS